jgi:hypothetical protein
MADSTTFRRALFTYFSATAGNRAVQKDEVRTSGDPIVLANASYWAALTDADLTGGAKLLHS